MMMTDDGRMNITHDGDYLPSQERHDLKLTIQKSSKKTSGRPKRYLIPGELSPEEKKNLFRKAAMWSLAALMTGYACYHYLAPTREKIETRHASVNALTK